MKRRKNVVNRTRANRRFVFICKSKIKISCVFVCANAFALRQAQINRVKSHDYVHSSITNAAENDTALCAHNLKCIRTMHRSVGLFFIIRYVVAQIMRGDFLHRFVFDGDCDGFLAICHPTRNSETAKNKKRGRIEHASEILFSHCHAHRTNFRSFIIW